MHVHINHCFCMDPNWGGEPYWSRYMVAIQDKLSYDPKAKKEEDWINLTGEHSFFDQEQYDRYKDGKFFKGYSDEMLHDMCKSTTRRLAPKVWEWLEKNIEDTKENGRKGEKGFCVGTDAYNHRNNDFTIWFYRRSDALKFIKTWSVYKKPTTYFDYFKEIRKEIDFKTQKLKTVEEFTLL